MSSPGLVDVSNHFLRRELADIMIQTRIFSVLYTTKQVYLEEKNNEEPKFSFLTLY